MMFVDSPQGADLTLALLESAYICLDPSKTPIADAMRHEEIAENALTDAIEEARRTMTCVEFTAWMTQVAQYARSMMV